VAVATRLGAGVVAGWPTDLRDVHVGRVRGRRGRPGARSGGDQDHEKPGAESGFEITHEGANIPSLGIARGLQQIGSPFLPYRWTRRETSPA
jgi:hypothetical protein